MNYRHAFHAGNFADVIKHAVLARILTYLHGKPAAFRVIDTHAGAGLYDLTSEEAQRGGEWQDGIGRVIDAEFSAEVAALLAPYLDIVRAFNVQTDDAQALDSKAPDAEALGEKVADPPAIARLPFSAPLDKPMRGEAPPRDANRVQGRHKNAVAGTVVDAPSRAPLRHASLRAYPGSPLIARALLRPQDRLIACEMEPGAHAALINSLYRDEQARVVDLDGWLALNAFVPPSARRGLVIVDPPFEQRNEFDRYIAAMRQALQKWPNGTYLLWYPVKDVARAEAFIAQIAQAVPDRDKLLRIEIQIAAPHNESGLVRTGLLIVNPPWVLERELALILPALTDVLARDEAARFWLERPAASRLKT